MFLHYTDTIICSCRFDCKKPRIDPSRIERALIIPFKTITQVTTSEIQGKAFSVKLQVHENHILEFAFMPGTIQNVYTILDIRA